MTQTIDLLDKALKQKTISEWARTFNMTPSAITNARARGRLSPTLAGNLAMKLGENPEQWIAIAALEAEPQSTLLEDLKANAKTWLHSSLVKWFKERRKHPRLATA